MVHTYSNKASNNHQHINQMNAFNNQGNDDSATATFDTKEGLFNLKHGGSSTNGSSSSTASCSSSSSNAGDTSSSCGSTAASSRAVGKRRSGTFKLAIPSWHRSAALIRKNFMQTFRNIGYDKFFKSFMTSGFSNNGFSICSFFLQDVLVYFSFAGRSSHSLLFGYRSGSFFLEDGHRKRRAGSKSGSHLQLYNGLHIFHV